MVGEREVRGVIWGKVRLLSLDRYWIRISVSSSCWLDQMLNSVVVGKRVVHMNEV